MTDREYRQREGVSRSELWLLNPDNGGTPEKFKWALEHPEKPSPALIFGTLVHCLLLEPEKCHEQFSIWDDSVKRTTKEGKALYSQFLETLGDRQEVSLSSYNQASAMVEKLRETPFVNSLLSGTHEAPFFWEDPDTNELCKIRLDCLTEIGDALVVVDYKTAADASLDGFTRHALKYGYDFQTGMYCEGIERVTGRSPRFVFIVQEKEPPFAVNVVEADHAFIQRGKDKMRELLGIYHECKTTNNWYGYMGADPVIETLHLPSWAAKE